MTPPRLADLTTLRIGGVPNEFVRAETTDELVDVVRQADRRGDPCLVLGGGSNVVAPDEGLEATVVQAATSGIEVAPDTCGGAWVEVAAGVPWSELVELAVESRWIGIEALAGIPGSVGAAPVQNIGAYGASVSDVIARVTVLDRATGEIRVLAAADCGFGYRTSLIKKSIGAQGYPGLVVLSVAFQFARGDLAAPVRYAELAASLGVPVGQRAPMREVRDAVLSLRRGKGMVLDQGDHDTWSVGSFFTNPIVDAAVADRLSPEVPRWPEPSGRVKVSAAWLVEHSGHPRGWRIDDRAAVSLSHKHSLAITNRGGGTSFEVIELAAAIRRDVADQFEIQLEPEPVLLGGLALD